MVAPPAPVWNVGTRGRNMMTALVAPIPIHAESAVDGERELAALRGESERGMDVGRLSSRGSHFASCPTSPHRAVRSVSAAQARVGHTLAAGCRSAAIPNGSRRFLKFHMLAGPPTLVLVDRRSRPDASGRSIPATRPRPRPSCTGNSKLHAVPRPSAWTACRREEIRHAGTIARRVLERRRYG
jgi:hypothetical protein